MNFKSLQFLFFSFISLFTFCTDDSDLNNIVTVNMGILENYSYFEVDVSAAPVTVSQIAQKSGYTNSCK